MTIATRIPIAHRLTALEQHYAALGLTGNKSAGGKPPKPVIVNGVRYANSHEAGRALGICEATIREVCRGQHRANRTKRFTARYATKGCES